MTRRGAAGAARAAAALAAAAAFTTVLAQHSAGSTFTAATDSAGNQVAAAASFCATPGGTTVTVAADAWIDQGSPAQNNGADSNLHVRSKAPGGSPANQRALVRFALPALPAGCALTAATLRLYNNSPLPGRTIAVYQADPAAPAWTENGVTWVNQPPTAGTAVTSVTAAAGWQQWAVTAQVHAHYADPNNGFLIRDQTENHPGGPRQSYLSRESGSDPALVLSWG